jgi:hypothetical protein
MNRPEPTLREIIADIDDEGELTGLTGQLQHDNRWTKETENLVEMRREEIRKAKGWK